MKKEFVGFSLLFILLAIQSYAAPKQIVYGWVEPVKVFPYKITLLAKLDTGTKTSSIDAKIIKYYYAQGKRYVRFQFSYGAKGKSLIVEKPVIKFIKIKRRTDEVCSNQMVSKRPVVLFHICMGRQSHTIQVNLANRQNFKHRFLLGRDAINQFSAWVDPKRTQTKNAKCRY